MKDYTITHSDEYKAYMKALSKLASRYVLRIRVQFAERAYENYKNETIRRLVLEYGKEIENLEEYRLRHFTWEAERVANEENNVVHDYWLEDDILNNAEHYHKAIYMLFNITNEEKDK